MYKILKQKKLIKILLIASVVLVGFSFVPPKPQLTIFLAGDDTMADQPKSAKPATGWGTRFNNFFDSTVVINNQAMNGVNSKTYIASEHWKNVMANVKAGDYVIIQFSGKQPINPPDFKKNLQSLITQVKKERANAVLITPTATRIFDSAGTVKDGQAGVAEIVRRVSVENRVPLIDLDTESTALIQKYGPERSQWLFNYLKPGQNPNYPAGKSDDVHLNELGARKVAEMVLTDLRKLSPELNSRVVTSKWEAN